MGAGGALLAAPPSVTVQPHGELPPLPIVLHLDGAALFQEAERRRVRHSRAAGLCRVGARSRRVPGGDGGRDRAGPGRGGGTGSCHRRAAAGSQLCATCPRRSQWPRCRFVLIHSPGS